MEIKIKAATPNQQKSKPADETKLGFGTLFSDHMFLMDHIEGEGWVNPRIEPYGPLSLDPSAMVLHYGQEAFEGLKAYRGQDDSIYLFRPTDNFKRLNRSSYRLCMPELDVDFALEALSKLLELDKDWIPKSRGASLYIRPNLIATEPQLGVRPSKRYLFYIITGPVGPYYKEGFTPVTIFAEDTYIRAALGGLGEAKTVANYAASLFAAEEAKKKGFTQVLWLDAKDRTFVEEVGTMNIFFVIGDEVITAPLNGTILPGITRDSVIQLVKKFGVKMSERSLSMDDVISAARDGSLQEVFGTGTAAVISPVGRITYKGVDYDVAGRKTGDLSLKLYDTIGGIQYGAREDPFGWRKKIL